MTTDIRDIPRYSAAEAGRLTGLDAYRVRRWTKGCSRHYSKLLVKEPPATYRKPTTSKNNPSATGYATFLDLVDLLFVRCYLSDGVGLQKIRKAVNEAAAATGDRHVACRNRLGSNKEMHTYNDGEWKANLLQLLSAGQWIISEQTLKIARQVEFDSEGGLAERWYPYGKSEGIVVDPAVNFGAPSVAGKAVRTSNIYDLYQAESENVEGVATWMNLPVTQIKSAVRFEQALVG